MNLSDYTIIPFENFVFVQETALIHNSLYIPTITKFLLKLISFYFSSPVPLFVLINDPRFDTPQTLNTYDEIHISCEDIYWCQIAYQLSHELCHLMIGKAVPLCLRWLEESIAEVSSLFFMRKLSTIWRKNGILGNPNYATAIENYVDNRINSVSDSVCLSEIGISDSKLWKYLCNEPYNRDLNAQIAKRILPIFETQPSLWAAVPAIGNLSPDQPLSVSFSEWIQHIDSKHHPGVQEISKVFFPDKTN